MADKPYYGPASPATSAPPPSSSNAPKSPQPSISAGGGGVVSKAVGVLAAGLLALGVAGERACARSGKAAVEAAGHVNPARVAYPTSQALPKLFPQGNDNKDK